MTERLRIFISSPGDVTPERLIAKRVVDRLAREFVHHRIIEPILWEREPLVATGHFQAEITPPSETDIVVVIIWSRLGTALPLDEFPGPLSGGEVTGTEWEFEDAVKAYREHQLPDLLVYRKQAPVMASLEDEEELDRQRHQKALVEKFIRTWFVNVEDNTFRAASHSFNDPVTFEETLESHLRDLISDRIGEQSASSSGIRWHEGSPFLGLETFETRHAQIFFGRSRARNELRELLVKQDARGSAFVLVFGASGSGKSSLVKAGLLPDLMLPGMVDKVGLCRVAVMRPSDVGGDLFAGLSTAILKPAEDELVALPGLRELSYDEPTLAAQLRSPEQAMLPIRQGLSAAGKMAGLSDRAEARLAIVIDQFEELFTHEFDPAERESFVQTIAALARSGAVWVIATMRSDFFDRLTTVPGLVQLTDGEGRYLLSPPTMAEIGQIIVQPAKEAGLRFETDADGIPLDEVLREEANKDPAALPLLEFTLDRLWQERVVESGLLTYQAYAGMGGMEGALGQHAEAAFNRLDGELQDVFPAVMRALLTVGQGQRDGATARTTPMSTFAQGSAQRKLVDTLLRPENRLLRVDGDGEGARVRVAHEALLRCWPRVTQQIEADRQDLQVRGRLEQAVLRWQQAKEQDRASLLLTPGLPLSEAENLLERRGTELDASWRTYVEQSVEARDAKLRKEREQERQALESAEKLAAEKTLSARRFKRWFVLAACIGLVALMASVLAYFQSVQARTQTAIAKAQKARILLRDKPVEGLIEAIEAYGVSQSVNYPWHVTPDEVRNSLFGALQVARVGAMEINALRGHEDWVSSLAVSANGALMASGSDDGSLWFWDSEGKAVAGPVESGEGDVNGIAISADGSVVVSGHASGAIRLWDGSGNPVGEPLKAHEKAITSVAISTDGEVIASGAEDSKVLVFNGDLQPMGWPFTGHTDEVMSVALSSDGKLIASASNDGTVRLSDLQGNAVGEPFEGHWQDVNAVAFSPDDEILVSGGWDKTIRLWNVASGQQLGEPIRGHENAVVSVAFSPNGQTIVSGSEDRTVRVWNLRGQALTPPLKGHAGPVKGVALHPDRKRIVSASTDATVRLWQRPEPLQGHVNPVHSLAAAKDGGGIVSASEPEENGLPSIIRLWDWLGNPAGSPLTDEDGFSAVAMSDDGQTVVVGTVRGTISIWDRDAKPIAREIDAHSEMITSLAIASGGRFFVSGAEDGSMRFWDAVGNAEGDEFAAHDEEVASIAISRDGETIASASWDDTVQLWNRQGEALLDEPYGGHEDTVRAVAISEDGQTIASGGHDNSVRLWDRAGRALAEPMVGHEDVVLSVAFLPGEQFIVSASEDSTLRLWRRDGKAVGLPMVGHRDWVTGVAVHPDGNTLVSSSNDGMLRLWSTERLHEGETAWLDEACELLAAHSVYEEEIAAAARAACDPPLYR